MVMADAFVILMFIVACTDQREVAGEQESTSNKSNNGVWKEMVCQKYPFLLKR